MFIQEALELYEPQWIRDGVGLSFFCPGHAAMDHRVKVYFDNPLGDEVAHEPGPFVHRLGDELEDLTLASMVGRPEDPLLILGHWRGWLAHSLLIYSVQSAVRGVAW